ncbi:hypothetical protein VPH35_059157 [Triticum aestivum]
MSALRCAARRLGGSLLQCTQGGEGSQLMPSRLMRCRELSSEQACEIQQKKEALYDVVANAEQKHWELYLRRWRLLTSIFLRIMMYGRRAQVVIELAAKMTCFIVFSVSMVGLSGMKDKMSKLRESSEDNVEI